MPCKPRMFCSCLARLPRMPRTARMARTFGSLARTLATLHHTHRVKGSAEIPLTPIELSLQNRRENEVDSRALSFERVVVTWESRDGKKKVTLFG